MKHGVLAISITVVVILVAIQPLVTSQDTEGLQPTFGQAIVAVCRAELAGATPNEIAELVQLLNKALDLNREALQLNSTGQPEERARLLTQVDQTLATVNSQAEELAITSTQRSYYNVVSAYVLGVIAAILGTLAFVIAVRIHREYQIKRTFQMRVTPK